MAKVGDSASLNDLVTLEMIMTFDVFGFTLVLVFFLCAWTSSASGMSNRPGNSNARGWCSWEATLRAKGYGTSEEELSRALQDRRATMRALLYIRHTREPLLLDQIEELLTNQGAEGRLTHPSVTVQSTAAEVLAQHDRDKGIEWLQRWEKLTDEELLALDPSSTMAVANSAGALARRNDDRLARHLRIVLPRTTIPAARALAHFTDIENEEIEQAWIDAAEIARKTLIAAKSERPRGGYGPISLFLNALNSSSAHLTTRKHVKPTPRMLEAFEALAEVEVALRDGIEERATNSRTLIQGEFGERRFFGRRYTIDYNQRFQRLIDEIRNTWRTAAESDD